MQNQRRVMARAASCGVRTTPSSASVTVQSCPGVRMGASCPLPQPAPKTGDCLQGTPSLAMVYGPCQEFTNLYGLDEGLKNGTIFRDLDLIFRPGNGVMPRNGGCK